MKKYSVVRIKKQLALIQELLMPHFKDKDLTIKWMFAPNPNLGGASPFNLIAQNKIERLLTMIHKALLKRKDV